MKFNVQKCLIILTAIFLEAVCFDYVTSHESDELIYTSSKSFPKQLAVYNSTGEVGVIIDSDGERFAVLNGETATGVIIDKRLGMGVRINEGAWKIYQKSLQDYIQDVNISKLIDMNSDGVFELEDQESNSEPAVTLQRSMQRFSPGFVLDIATNSKNIFKGILDVFGFIIHPIKFVFGSLLEFALPGWLTFHGGFMALLNIFSWMGKLISSVIGGLPTLIKAAVLFPLGLLIGAVDGARRFFIILARIARSIDLMTILKGLLKAPIMIIKFIIGLGGCVLGGVTGIFGILLRLTLYTKFKIATFVFSLAKTILRFLRFGRRTTYEEVTDTVDELLKIPKQQQERFNNGKEFDEYNSFLESVKGKGNYNIKNFPLGTIVKAVTKSTSSAKATVMNVLNCMKHVIPFGKSLPTLLVSMVRSLNSTEGVSYVKQIIPSLKIPKEELENTRNIAGTILKSTDSAGYNLRSLPPAPELFRKLPVISDIYRELDEAAYTYENTSLDNMLTDQHRADVVEFTTAALEL